MVKFLKEHVIIHFNNNSYKGDTMLKVFKVALLGALVATFKGFSYENIK